MSVARTLNCPPTTLGAPKSVKQRMKLTIPAEMSPYFTPGRVTVRKVRVREAPSEAAAS